MGIIGRKKEKEILIIMKKIVAMLLCCAMAFSVAACGSDNQGSNTQQDSQSGNDTQQTGGNTQQDSQGGGEQTSGDALSLFTTIWENFPEDGKFSCYGGNVGENALQGAPDKFDVSDTDGMTATFLIPESVQPNVDDAATLLHGMMANNFTGVVIHVNGDVSEAANAIKDKILGNQWMCGFPEKLAVFTAGDYVIYAFGSEMNIDNFVSAATGNISGITEVYNDFL